MGKYVILSEIAQKPPLCGLAFITVDRPREREKAELTKGSRNRTFIPRVSQTLSAPKAVYRVVAYSASPSVIRSHLRAWGMISRSSPSISALADFPTPRVSLVRFIGCPTGLPNGMSIGLDTEISRANRSHRCQRRRGLCHGDRCRRDLRSMWRYSPPHRPNSFISKTGRHKQGENYFLQLLLCPSRFARSERTRSLTARHSRL